MRIAAKFSITLNNLKFNENQLAIEYMKQKSKETEVDHQLLQQQITQNYNQIIQHFKKDHVQLAQFVKYAQRITNNPLDSYQEYLLQLVKTRFPSKPFLLWCLQLKSEFNLDVLKTMPNSVQDPLIHGTLNYLILNHTLDYKESTSVLHFLHNRKVLKQLLQCDWVQNYINKSKQGLSEPNLRNLALLSRIYADVSQNYLHQVAQALEKIDIEQKTSNQLSYVTLYQNLSILKNKKDLLKKISSHIQLNLQTDVQELMQLLIGVGHSKDKSLASLVFNLIKNKEKTNEDQVLYYLTGTYFQLIDEQIIQDQFKDGTIFNLLKMMNPKQIGEFCMHLKTNYKIDLVPYIKENPEFINSQNVVNFFLLDEKKILDLTSLIEQCLKNKSLDLVGIMQLSFHKEFKKEISKEILQYKFEDICFNVKELSSILLNVDLIVTDLGTLIEDSVKAVNLDLSNSEGLGNLLYLHFKRMPSRRISLPEKVIAKIIRQCDPLELINFLKGLDKQRLLTSELQNQIIGQIKKKVSNTNRLRLQRSISKIPMQLQFSLD